MRKLSGSVRAAIIVGLIAALLIGATIFLVNNNNTIVERYHQSAFVITEAEKINGYIADHVRGKKDAPVIIYEYADYQCEYCALMNPYVEEFIEESDGKLAVVYRNYILSYHQNGTAAASAAEAAGLQGYWQEYANKLFEKQEEWYSASANERTALFDKYLLIVSDNKADVDKFNSNLSSPDISQKLTFDMKIGKFLEIPGTPSFYIDGQYINWGNKDGGSLVINGETIEWDHKLSIDEFSDLIKQIIEIKTK